MLDLLNLCKFEKMYELLIHFVSILFIFVGTLKTTQGTIESIKSKITYRVTKYNICTMYQYINRFL